MIHRHANDFVAKTLTFAISDATWESIPRSCCSKVVPARSYIVRYMNDIDLVNMIEHRNLVEKMTGARLESSFARGKTVYLDIKATAGEFTVRDKHCMWLTRTVGKE